MKKSHRQIKHWKKHKGLVLDSVNEFDVIDCEACGFKHIIPIPTFEEIEDAYREKYYSVEKPLYLEHTREDLDWWNLVYSERYDIFEKLLPIDRRKILDVGSGPGFFLVHGKQRGWKPLGIEPSAQAAAHSRELGLEIIEDFLTQETAKQLVPFDVIHMHEVLEHIPDPKEMLQLISRLLSPQGLLCVVVPNDYNPFQHILRAVCNYEPWWVQPPHHINYFNFDSLETLLSSSGFDVVSREATFPIDIFLLMGDNYIGNDKIGRACHTKRKQLELNLHRGDLNEFKKELYQFFASKNVGREMVFFAQKRNKR